MGVPNETIPGSWAARCVARYSSLVRSVNWFDSRRCCARLSFGGSELRLGNQERSRLLSIDDSRDVYPEISTIWWLKIKVSCSSFFPALCSVWSFSLWPLFGISSTTCFFMLSKIQFCIGVERPITLFQVVSWVRSIEHKRKAQITHLSFSYICFWKRWL